MMSWVLLLGGLLLAAASTTVAVSAAAVSRLELTRWISHRLRGAAVASTLFSAPGRILRTANAFGAVGVLAAGFGFAGVMRFIPPLGVLVAALGFGVPVIAVCAYGLPRVIGQRRPEAIMRRASPWGGMFATMLSPILPLNESDGRTRMRDVLLAGNGEGEADDDEIEMISGVLAFTNRVVREVMTPRTDVVPLSEGASLEEVGRIFSESGYSRLPVYRDSLDNILGMIYAFDLMKVTPGGELPIRPVSVVPGSKECAAVLLELQRERRQMAVVLDEFGGTAGIVTLEDLLEELVGEIFDEGEDERPSGSGPDIVEVDGATSSGEIASRFGVELPSGAETIGGLLARRAGRIPKLGERLVLDGLEFDVLGATPTRIERVAVRRGPVRATTLTPPAGQ